MEKAMEILSAVPTLENIHPKAEGNRMQSEREKSIVTGNDRKIYFSCGNNPF